MVGQVLISTVACSPAREVGGRLLLKVAFSGESHPGEAGVPHLCTGVKRFQSAPPLFVHPVGDSWQSGWVGKSQTLCQRHGHVISFRQKQDLFHSVLTPPVVQSGQKGEQ